MTGPDGASWTVTPQQAVERRDGKSTVYPLDIPKPGFRLNTFADRDGYLWIGEYAVHRVGRRHGPPLRRSRRPAAVHQSLLLAGAGRQRLVRHAAAARRRASGWCATRTATLRTWGTESGLLRRLDLQRLPRPRGHDVAGHQQGPGRLRKNVLQTFSVKDGLDDGGGLSPLSRPPGAHLDRHDQGAEPLRERHVLDRRSEAGGPSAPREETWRGPEMSVQSLWEDPQGPHVGRRGRRHLHRRHGHRRAAARLHGHHVFAIHGDRHGNVWAATNRGLLRYRDDRLVATLDRPRTACRTSS